MDVKKRIDELIEIINRANKEYYIDSNPTLTDQEYDNLIHELIELENANPELVRKDSPTQKINVELDNKFIKTEHKKPMLSLSNVFSYEEVENFLNKLPQDILITCEPKIDGLAISLVYESGKLIRGVTRGNGLIGENITNNVMTIESIPKTLKENIDIEIRGEIFMPKNVFESLNKLRINNNEAPFANPRNAASGSVRQLNSEVTKTRKLNCFLYQLVDRDKDSHYESLSYLKKLGFNVNDQIKQVNKDSVIEYIKKIEDIRSSLPYEIDGVVLKVDSKEIEEEVGYTSKYPKWATAYKFKAEEALTRVKDIFFTVGRTGKITPNAELDPVIVAGSRVGKVTLHNEDYLIEKDIRIGDYVYIRKAGDVIPEVVRVDFDKRKETKKVSMPTNCPICGTKVIRKENESATVCINTECPARKQESLIHFVGRNAMNIEGFGEGIIEELFSLGYLSDASSFFELSKHEKELKNLSGYGIKSIDNMLESIEKAKKVKLSSFIFALGIRHVGYKTAKVLAENFDGISSLMEAESDELIAINEIGEKIADSVVKYFKKEENINLIHKLLDNGVEIEKEQNKSDKLSQTSFVITGSFEEKTRDELKQIIEENSGEVKSSVSTKIDYLLCGEKPGSKYDKAKELNIKTISLSDFLDMVK